MAKAELDAVRARTEEWTDAQVLCRTSGHTWVPQTVHHTPGWYAVTQRCSRRCGCTRHQDMAESGHATKWIINYPPGYLVSGFGRVDADGRAIIRLASIRHQRIIEVPPDE